MDSYYNIRPFQLSGLLVESHRVETDADYKRYELTPTGISPRGLPGYGSGVVAVDSDEHDEEGHITEDLHLRRRMTEKRLKKYPGEGADILPPRTAGPPEASTLLLSWGSNYPVLCEALQLLERDDLALLHFSQVWPLPSETGSRLRRATRRILVENNATAQFGQVLAMSTGVTITEHILKYDGLPFTVEELAGRISAQLEEGR